MKTQSFMIERYHTRRVLEPVLGGMAGLAVAMGIGRFAYTPLLPVMEDQFHFSVSFAGLLASWNYLGYLVGAIAAGWLPGRFHSRFNLRCRFIIMALVGSCMTTGAMAFTSSHLVWSILRALGGLFSAGVFVLSSSLIMDWLTMQRQTTKIGIFYAGVGIGIALTGISVPVLRQYGGWQLGWSGLGIMGLILTVGVWLSMWTVRTLPPLVAPSAAPAGTMPAAPFPLWAITVAYGLEGLGYIVMATFITAFFRHVSSVSWLGDASWIIVGLAAAPSTWLWTKAAHAIGWKSATCAAYICQGVGVLLPVVWPGVATAIAGSILLGGTFVGITTLSLSIGRQCAPFKAGRIIGNMTAMFGAGQVVGPVAAGAITAATHSYDVSMLLSGLLLLGAAALLWLTRNTGRKVAAVS